MDRNIKKEDLIGRLERIGFWQYRNPDERCTYPFTPDAIGYCWSYALYIDQGDKFLKRNQVEKMEDICKGCELWKNGHEKTS